MTDATVSAGPLTRDEAGVWHCGDVRLGTDGEFGSEEIVDALLRLLPAESDGGEWQSSTTAPGQLGFGWSAGAEPPVLHEAGLTLAEAHKRVMAGLDRGVWCPCCQRLARRYPRVLSKEMARFVVLLYDYGLRVGRPTRYHHVRDFVPNLRDTPKASSDGAYLVLWGLVERGASDQGSYRLLDAGRDWIAGRCTVPRVAWVYGGRPYAFSRERVSLDQVVHHYHELEMLLRRVREHAP